MLSTIYQWYVKMSEGKTLLRLLYILVYCTTKEDSLENEYEAITVKWTSSSTANQNEEKDFYFKP